MNDFSSSREVPRSNLRPSKDPEAIGETREWCIEMTDFTFSTDLQVRFRDLDPMGHVNHAVYASYLEAARSVFYREVLDQPLEKVDTVIVHIELDYDRSIELGDEPVCHLGVERVGETSLTIRYELRLDGDIAATAETTQVVLDENTGRAREIPSAWREELQ